MSLGNILWNIKPRSGIWIWVDPASFAAMESDSHLLYFTKISGKSLDFYFLVGIHLNRFQPKQTSYLSTGYTFSCLVSYNTITKMN